MRTSFWESVVEDGCRVPSEAPLDELTTELVAMLGQPDRHVRDDLAYGVLAAWIGEGVYDDLLPGLGDGLAHALRQGLGDDGTDSVLRRSFSALVLADVVRRDNTVHLLHPQQVVAWADRGMSWYVAERDLRGWEARVGWIHAVAHGADLMGSLAASRHLGAGELAVLLDVLAERLLAPTRHRWSHGEDDRIALATMSILHRDLVAADTCETWLERLAAPFGGRFDPFAPQPSNVSGYLRALHLQLLLGVDRTATQAVSAEPWRAPAVRGDMLIAVQGLLRRSAPYALRQA